MGYVSYRDMKAPTVQEARGLQSEPVRSESTSGRASMKASVRLKSPTRDVKKWRVNVRSM